MGLVVQISVAVLVPEVTEDRYENGLRSFRQDKWHLLPVIWCRLVKFKFLKLVENRVNWLGNRNTARCRRDPDNIYFMLLFTALFRFDG